MELNPLEAGRRVIEWSGNMLARVAGIELQLTDTQTDSNYDASRAEETSFYSTKGKTIHSPMSGSLSRQLQKDRLNRQ